MQKKKTISLNIPRLGGVQDFETITQKELKDYDFRYVCSTWEGDGFGNKGDWDILNFGAEYKAVATNRIGMPIE